MSFATFNDDL